MPRHANEATAWLADDVDGANLLAKADASREKLNARLREPRRRNPDAKPEVLALARNHS
jgi:hypothetical protein